MTDNNSIEGIDYDFFRMIQRVMQEYNVRSIEGGSISLSPDNKDCLFKDCNIVRGIGPTISCSYAVNLTIPDIKIAVNKKD